MFPPPCRGSSRSRSRSRSLCHQSRPLRVSIPLLTEWCRGNASGTRLNSSTSGRGAALVPGCVPAADGTRPRFGILGRWHARPDPVAERACVPTWVEWMCVYAPLWSSGRWFPALRWPLVHACVGRGSRRPSAPMWHSLPLPAGRSYCGREPCVPRFRGRPLMMRM